MATRDPIGERLQEIEGKPLGKIEPHLAGRLGGKPIYLQGNLPNYALGLQPQPTADQMPYYDRLTRTERWLQSALGTVAESKAGKFLGGLSETKVGKAVFGLLDVGAEALERTTGFGAQWAMTLGDPVHKAEFDENLRAAWYAGSLTADLVDLPRFNEEGQFGYTSDMPGIDGIIGARKKLAQLMAQGMEGKEALALVKNELYNDFGALAFRAAKQDAIFHIAADPINILMPYLKPIERLKLAQLGRMASKAIPDEVIKVTSAIDDALKVTKNVDEVARLNEARLFVNSLDKLSPLEQRVIRLMNVDGNAKSIWSKINPLGLTPDARAHLLADNVVDNVLARVVSRSDDPEEIMRTIMRIADGTSGPELGHMIVSVEGRVARSVVQDIATEAQALTNAYAKTASERTMLGVIAKATNESIEQVFKQLDEGEAQALFARFNDLADPQAQRMASELAVNLGMGNLGPEMLEGITKVFGDTKLLSPDLYKVYLIDAIADSTARLAVARYGVKAKGFLQKLAQSVKSVETLAFLRTNPGYFIRNLVNNEFTMLARGAWSWSRESGEFFWRQMGFEPARLKAGFGYAGDIGLAVGEGSLKKVDAILQEVTSGKRGALDKITDWFNGRNLGKADMGQHAASVERTASVRAYTAFGMRYWRQHRQIPSIADFQRLATELGDEAPVIERALKSLMNEAEIDDFIAGGKAAPLNMTGVVDDTSRQLGKNLYDVMPAEEAEHFVNQLIDAQKTGGAAAVRDTTETLRRNTLQKIADSLEEELPMIQGEIAARVEVEGPGALPEVLGDMMDSFQVDAHTKHALDNSRFMDEFADLKKIEPGIADAAINQKRALDQIHWDGEWNRVQATVDGVVDGFKAIEKQTGQKFPFLTDVKGAVRSWRNGWKKFYELRNTTQKKFWDLRKAGKTADWDGVVKTVDDAYATAVTAEAEFLGQIDEITMRLLPDESKPLFGAWRTSVAEARMADKQLVMDFFRDPLKDGRSIYDLTAAERQMAFNELGGLRNTNWKKIVQLEKDGLDVMLGDTKKLGMFEGRQLPLPAAGEAVGEAAEAVSYNVQGTPFHDLVPRTMREGEGYAQLWMREADDALNMMRDNVIDASKRRPVKFDGLSADALQELKTYTAKVRGSLSDERYKMSKFAEWGRDSALLNYNRRMNYNTWLGMLAPYEFWTTNSIYKWALHTIDRPFMASAYMKMEKFMSEATPPQEGLPARLHGSIKVKVPFLPDYLGSNLFIDPLSLALPFRGWSYAADQFIGQNARDEDKAAYVLEELLNDGKITQDQYNLAIKNGAGPVWDRALSLAQLDDTEGRRSWFDFGSMLTQPHAPVMWAYHAARGKPEDIGPFIPLTRSIKGVTAMLGIGPPEGINIEGAIRKNLGLPAFDQWDDYRVDRMITNMVADEAITLDVALRAMTERDTATDPEIMEAFVEGRRRAGQEFGWGAMGSLIGMPAKAYPPGEENLRKQRDDYEYAWERYEGGDSRAIDRFYEENPNYEARLMLFKSPEERLQRFVIDGIWNQWNDMPTLHKKEASDQLGPLFTEAFLDKETRSYDSIPTETLQVWLEILGGDPPGHVQFNENLTPIQFTDPEAASRLDAFYNTRRQRYGGRQWELQEEYFKLDNAARTQFRKDNPLLVDYWDYRRNFMYRNPDLAPYLEDDPDKRPKVPEIPQQPNFTQQEWQSVLGLEMYRLIQDEGPLSPAVQEALSRLGVTRDQVTGGISQ